MKVQGMINKTPGISAETFRTLCCTAGRHAMVAGGSVFLDQTDVICGVEGAPRFSEHAKKFDPSRLSDSKLWVS